MADDDDDFDLFGDLEDGKTPSKKSATGGETPSATPASATASKETTEQTPASEKSDKVGGGEASVDDLLSALNAVKQLPKQTPITGNVTLQEEAVISAEPTETEGQSSDPNVFYDSGPPPEDGEEAFYDSGPWDPNAYQEEDSEMKSAEDQVKGSLAIVSDSESDGDDLDLSMGASAAAGANANLLTPARGTQGGKGKSASGRGGTSGVRAEASRLEVKLYVSVPPPLAAIMSDNEPYKCCIIVGNLPMELTDMDLRRHCEGFGSVRLVRFWEHFATGMSTGLAVVQYTTEAAAKRACEKENGLSKLAYWSSVEVTPVVEMLPQNFHYEMTSGVIGWLEGGECTSKFRGLLQKRYGRKDINTHSTKSAATKPAAQQQQRQGQQHYPPVPQHHSHQHGYDGYGKGGKGKGDGGWDHSGWGGNGGWDQGGWGAPQQGYGQPSRGSSAPHDPSQPMVIEAPKIVPPKENGGGDWKSRMAGLRGKVNAGPAAKRQKY